jgi:hypothetical protein
MPSSELIAITEATINSIQLGTCKRVISSLRPRVRTYYRLCPQVTEEYVLKLRTLFPDTLILAALDLIDRDSGALILLLFSRRNSSSSNQSSNTQHRGVAPTSRYSGLPPLTPYSRIYPRFRLFRLIAHVLHFLMQS